MRRSTIAMIAVVLLLSVQVLGIVCPAAAAVHARCPLAAVMHCEGSRCAAGQVRTSHTPDQTTVFEAAEPSHRLRAVALVAMPPHTFALPDGMTHRVAVASSVASSASPGGTAPTPLRI